MLISLLRPAASTQADQQQLGSVSIPASQAPRGWVAATSTSSLLRREVAVPLDAGSIHQFLAFADSEDARKQVGGRIVSVGGRHGWVGDNGMHVCATHCAHQEPMCVWPCPCAQVYLAGATSPEANLGLLDHILATRHELARLLGYESYAAFKAADGTLAGGAAGAQGVVLCLWCCPQQWYLGFPKPSSNHAKPGVAAGWLAGCRYPGGG